MRTVGTLGMSIGTSSGIELGDAGASIRNSDVVLFNIFTLIRNAYDAYEDKEEKAAVKSDQLIKDVIEDLKLISRWMEDARKNKPISMIVYYPTYFSLGFKFPLAEIKKPKTALQIEYDELTKLTAKELYKQFDKLIQKTDVGMPAFKGKGIVLTHHVVDLAVYEYPARLTLLESHTGKLKPYTQWYTKLTGGDELHYMPFNKLTIQVFGDRATNFFSSSMKIKNLVKSIAMENKWTSATTVSRVRNTINSMDNSLDRTGLLKML